MSRLRWLPVAFSLLGLAPTALAQTVSLGTRGTTDGLTLPPASAATVEDAAAGEINPAGLGLMRDLQLEYFHERETLSDGLVGDGLYLADTLFDVLAVGLSLEWLRPGDGPAFHKTHWTVAFSPDRSFSLGLAYNLFGSSYGPLDSLTTWDFGLTWRPWQFLSLATSIRDFDHPALGAGGPALPRRYDFAAAVRPFGPCFSLAADYLFLGEDNLSDSGLGPGRGRVGLTAQLEAPRGLSYFVGVGFPVAHYAASSPNPAATTFIQLGLSLATEHVAAFGSYAPSTDGQPFALGAFDVGLRLSKNAFAPLPTLAGRILLVDLGDELNPTGGSPLSLLAGNEGDPFENLLTDLHRAALDGAVAGVTFRYSDLPGLSLGRVEELRTALLDLRAHGKQVTVLLQGGSDPEYYLATAADRIYGEPQTDYLLKGFSAHALFVAAGLQKLGIHVDVVRVGAYKNAPDLLTRDAPSPEQSEVLRFLLQESLDRYVGAVAMARGVTTEAFLRSLGRGISTADQARADKLLDDVVYPDQLAGKVSDALGRPIFFDRDYLHREIHQRRWANLPAVALVNVFGLITGGESQSGPTSLATIAGAQTIVRALRNAADDPSVKAIVVRVDSGGGDGAASELIWREIEQAKAQKPVVVSLGDEAASGGYYLAVAGDEILAEPSTITGSIGVFALKPDLSGLFDKLGIHMTVEKLTPNADLLSLTQPWTASQKSVMQSYVDAFYGTFVQRVAEGRHLSRAAVDAIGQGRVWSGEQAEQRGLIDGFGSLQEAIDHAKARAHLSAEQPIQLISFGAAHPFINLSLVGASASDKALSQLVSTTGNAPLIFLSSDRPLALAEQRVELR